MFNMIKRSFSGGADEKESQMDEKAQNKRGLSDDKSEMQDKRSKLERESAVDHNSDTDTETDTESESKEHDDDLQQAPDPQEIGKNDEEWQKNMPDNTPEWGQWILRVMRQDFQTLSAQVKTAQAVGSSAIKTTKSLNSKLEKLSIDNKKLQDENQWLQDKVADLEYRQRRSNLVFDGISYTDHDNDSTAFTKLQKVLHRSLGKTIERKEVERCHWMRSKTVFNKKSVICCFAWYGDVQRILKNRKLLPKGVYVLEDLPDVWLDSRKILKPIFNSARRMDSLKEKTFLTRDKLVIDGKAYTAGPDSNLGDLSGIVDVQGTCQTSDESKTIFQGVHSVFSNLHPASFVVDKIQYNCVEQAIQAGKASEFNDTYTHAKVMSASNPYRIKKLGSKVRNYNKERWSEVSRNVAYKAIKAKFRQNPILKDLLLSTGTAKIAESTKDPVWGTGVLLHSVDSMDETKWKQNGLMCELYQQIREELR